MPLDDDNIDLHKLPELKSTLSLDTGLGTAHFENLQRNYASRTDFPPSPAELEIDMLLATDRSDKAREGKLLAEMSLSLAAGDPRQENPFHRSYGETQPAPR